MVSDKRTALTPESLSRVKDVLGRQDWKDLLPRLVRMCLYLLRAKNGGAPSRDSTSSGKMAEDYVMDAIMKVYKGERRWDPEKHPNILFYFMGVLRSQIGHEHQRLENRAMVFVEDPADHESGAQGIWLHRDGGDDALVEEFQEFLRGEPQLAALVMHITQGCKPRDIAERMGLERTEIYNLRKLMKRRFMEFFHQRERRAGEHRQRTDDYAA